jgi:hypothetical protein
LGIIRTLAGHFPRLMQVTRPQDRPLYSIAAYPTRVGVAGFPPLAVDAGKNLARYAARCDTGTS